MSSNWWIKDDMKKNWIISNSTLSLCLRSFPLFCGIFISNPILRGKLAVAKFCGHPAAARGFFPILKFYLLSNKSHYVARERLMCSNRARSDLSQTVKHTIRLTCCQIGTRRRVPLKSICNQHWDFVTLHKITLSSQIWGKGQMNMDNVIEEVKQFCEEYHQSVENHESILISPECPNYFSRF